MTRGTNTALILPTHFAIRSIRNRSTRSSAPRAAGSVGFLRMAAFVGKLKKREMMSELSHVRQASMTLMLRSSVASMLGLKLAGFYSRLV